MGALGRLGWVAGILAIPFAAEACRRWKRSYGESDGR